MKKTINSLEKELISALLILTFSCSRELDSPPPGGLMSASNTISEYEMLNTSRIWFEENYQSPGYVVSWTNAKVHTTETAYYADASMMVGLDMKFLTFEETLGGSVRMIVKSAGEKRQARIMFISPDAENTQDVRLMDYNFIGTFTGKIYYFTPDEEFTYSLYFKNGQADNYYVLANSGNPGETTYPPEKITKEEYDKLSDEEKQSYSWNDALKCYKRRDFDDVYINPPGSSGGNGGLTGKLEFQPNGNPGGGNNGFYHGSGGGGTGPTGGSGGEQSEENKDSIQLPIPANGKVGKHIISTIKKLSKCIPEEYKQEIKKAVEENRVKITYNDVDSKSKNGNPIELRDNKNGTYSIDIYSDFKSKAGKVYGYPVGLGHELAHLILTLKGVKTELQHDKMITTGLMEKILRAYFPNESEEFFFYAKFGGAYDAKAYGQVDKARARSFYYSCSIIP